MSSARCSSLLRASMRVRCSNYSKIKRKTAGSDDGNPARPNIRRAKAGSDGAVPRGSRGARLDDGSGSGRGRAGCQDHGCGKCRPLWPGAAAAPASRPSWARGGESFCYLVSDGSGLERLKILKNCHDGFEIARQDLALRGTGEFFGERQHGEETFRAADLWKMRILCWKQKNPRGSSRKISQRILMRSPGRPRRSCESAKAAAFRDSKAG